MEELHVPIMSKDEVTMEIERPIEVERLKPIMGMYISPVVIEKLEPIMYSGDHLERITPPLEVVMQELRDANIKVIGLYGKNKIEIWNVIEKASRRASRDNLFDQVVVADLTDKSNLEMIQEQVARALNLSLSDGIMYRLLCYLTGRSIIAERAGQICERIRTKRRILLILHNLFQGFDMEQVGIPFGDTHEGCKILLTSTSQEVIKDKTKTDKIISL